MGGFLSGHLAIKSAHFLTAALLRLGTVSEITPLF
jgi:hypothetical protein